MKNILIRVFKSLEIQKELTGEKHVGIVTSYIGIGNVYLNKSEYDKALQYLKNFLEKSMFMLEFHIAILDLLMMTNSN